MHDSLAVIEAHIGYVPVFFFADPTKNIAQSLDVGETRTGDLAVISFESTSDEESGGRS
jgi:hypothetical protein